MPQRKQTGGRRHARKKERGRRAHKGGHTHGGGARCGGRPHRERPDGGRHARAHHNRDGHVARAADERQRCHVECQVGRHVRKGQQRRAGAVAAARGCHATEARPACRRRTERRRRDWSGGGGGKERAHAPRGAPLHLGHMHPFCCLSKHRRAAAPPAGWPRGQPRQVLQCPPQPQVLRRAPCARYRGRSLSARPCAAAARGSSANTHSAWATLVDVLTRNRSAS